MHSFRMLSSVLLTVNGDSPLNWVANPYWSGYSTIINADMLDGKLKAKAVPAGGGDLINLV